MRFLLPKLISINAKEAEKMLFDSNFILLRTKGSHRIYIKGDTRVVIPFHANKSLHPKIVKSIIEAINE